MAPFIRKYSHLVFFAIFAGSSLQASQWGPVFPSHRFPTDRSFHLSSSVGYGAESTFFDGDGNREDLGGSLSRIRLMISPEYQPNRDLSMGAYLNFDSLKFSGKSEELTTSGFSDQYLFGEYRVVDDVGYSMGFGTVFKIPLYSTPKSVDATTDNPFLLLGDGQIDATLLYCAEYWITKNIKFNGDLGVTYRTDEHATELPFQLAAEYITPQWMFGLGILGNLSFRNDKTGGSATTADIQTLTQNTNYVFARNPETINVMLKGEYALSSSWAINARFDNSIWAKSSPFFVNFAAGVSYRFFDPAERARSAREVGIETDDSTKEFDGEVQEGNEEIDSLQNNPAED